MTMALQIPLVDEHDLYPVHEEDSVPQIPEHFDQAGYLVFAARNRRPDYWVTSDMCLYWLRGAYSRYRAPDLVVTAGAPLSERPRVFLKWVDPPLLFVAEIGSRSSLVIDPGPKADIYEQHLQVPEYLYADPPSGVLTLWRMVDGRYVVVQPDSRGWVWSAQLEAWFGYDQDGFLRMYAPDGRMLLKAEEEKQRADAEAVRAELATQRAEAEARRAETEGHRADVEAQRADVEAQRADVEAQRADVEAQRANAEAEGARAEAAARIEFERRLAEVTAELERLREDRGPGS